MPDREKVLRELEALRHAMSEHQCYVCSHEFIDVADEFGTNIVDNAITLFKEQETGHWISLENCSNSGVYCSECHTKVFDNYPIKKKFSYFCPHCGTRMEGEIERR